MREIICESCGKKFTVDADDAIAVRCPHCRKEFRVPAAKDSGPIAREQNILPYGRPAPPRVRAGPFMLGFFGTLGFTAAAFFALFFWAANEFELVSADSEWVGRVFAVLFIAAIYVVIGWKARQLSKQPRWAGIGRGVIVGMCLGMIAMIPCAGVFIVNR
jgi:hypothetical protein